MFNTSKCYNKYNMRSELSLTGKTKKKALYIILYFQIKKIFIGFLI